MLLASAVAVAWSCGPAEPADEGSGAPDAHVGAGDDDGDDDGDGLSNARERELGTAPDVADSDADGYDDGDEVITKNFNPEIDNYLFNPLVADVPRAELILSSAPRIQIDYRTSRTATRTVGVESSSENSSTRSYVTGGSKSNAIEQAHTASFSAKVSGKAFQWGVEFTAGYSYENRSTNETTRNWSQEEMASVTQAYKDLSSAATEEGFEASGGRISITATIRNNGHRTWTVRNPVLVAYTLDPLDPSIRNPVTDLHATEALEITRQQGDEPYGPITFQGDLLLEQALELLQHGGLVVASPGMTLLDQDGTAAAFDRETMLARTARVSIDYGPNGSPDGRQPIEDYSVSAVSEGAAGIPVATIFRDVLRIPYATGTRPWKQAGADEVTQSFEGLVAVDGVEMDAAGSVYWTVVHVTKVDSGRRFASTRYDNTSADYDFDAIRIRPGDELLLVRISDADRDGLGDRAELRLGTNPLAADTDGDGLSDLEEVEGIAMTVAGVPAVFVLDPLRSDTDEDGLSDAEEREGWMVGDVRVYSSPVLADADDDELPDAAERRNGTDPNAVTNHDPVLAELSARADAYEATLSVRVDDGDGHDGTVQVAVTWEPGVSETHTVPTGRVATLRHDYGRSGTFSISAEAIDRFEGRSGVKTCQVTTTLTTAGLLAYFPFDQDAAAAVGDVRARYLSGHPTYGFTTGVRGRALDLTYWSEDGAENAAMVTCDHLPYGANGTFTLTCWLRMESFDGSRVLGQYEYLNLYLASGDRLAFGTLRSDDDEGDGYFDPAQRVLSGALAKGTWYFVEASAATTSRGTDLTLTVTPHGNSAPSPGQKAQLPALLNRWDLPFVLGGEVDDDWAGNKPVFGAKSPVAIDELRIYDRALSEVERKDLLRGY